MQPISYIYHPPPVILLYNTCRAAARSRPVTTTVSIWTAPTPATARETGALSVTLFCSVLFYLPSLCSYGVYLKGLVFTYNCCSQVWHTIFLPWQGLPSDHKKSHVMYSHLQTCFSNPLCLCHVGMRSTARGTRAARRMWLIAFTSQTTAASPGRHIIILCMLYLYYVQFPCNICSCCVLLQSACLCRYLAVSTRTRWSVDAGQSADRLQYVFSYAHTYI